jgi:hypothetical protein
MTDEKGGWVDSVVADTAPIKDVALAQLDLTTDFDELLANVFAADMPGEIVPLRRRRLTRKAGTLALAAVIVASAGAAAAVKGGALTGILAPGRVPSPTPVNTSMSPRPTTLPWRANCLPNSNLTDFGSLPAPTSER